MSADSVWARIARRLDPIAIWSGRLVCLLLVPLVLALTWEVVARYVFNAPTMWAYDLTFILYGSFFMLGTAFTLQRKGHVRTDMYYDRWPPRRQAAIDLACYLIIYFPFVSVFVFSGWEYFVKAYTMHETFVSSTWQPVTWPFKLSMPVAGVLMLIQGASEVCKCLHTLQRGAWPDERKVEFQA